MHPTIIQAFAAERSRDLQARAAGSRRAGQIQRTRRPRPVMSALQARVLRLGRPRRDLRPA